MATIINASNSTGLTLTSDLSGTLQFQNNGVNLPMSGVAPTFGVYCSGATSLPNNTWVKVAFDTKVWDTNTNFNTSTYRFTPTVAGYYSFTAGVFFGSNSSSRPAISLYKNGSSLYQVLNVGSSLIGGITINMAVMAYANGSTDYFEIYVVQDSGSTSTVNQDSKVTFWQGALVRGA